VTHSWVHTIIVFQSNLDKTLHRAFKGLQPQEGIKRGGGPSLVAVRDNLLDFLDEITVE